MSVMESRYVIEIGDFIKSRLDPIRECGFVTRIEERVLGHPKRPWVITFYTIADANGREHTEDPIDQEHAVLVVKSPEWFERLLREGGAT